MGLREFFESTFKAIQPLLAKFTGTLGSPAFLSAIKRLGAEVGKVFGNLIAPAQRALDFLSRYPTCKAKPIKVFPLARRYTLIPPALPEQCPARILAYCGERSMPPWVLTCLLCLTKSLAKLTRYRTVIGLLASGDIAGATAKIGAWVETVATALVGAWPTISAQLGKWGTKFWDWLTEPGGPISTAGTKIAGVVGAISGEVLKAWPTIAAELFKWGTQFWNWLMAPTGPINTASTKLDALVVKVTEWINLPSTIASLSGIGKTMGGNLVTGLESASQEATTVARINTALGSLLQLAADFLTLQRTVLVKIGGTLASGILDGIVSKVQTEGPGKLSKRFSIFWGRVSCSGHFLHRGKKTSRGLVHH